VTAINVIRQSHSVHVITDGASYGPPGQHLHPSTKTWPLPHLNAVIAGRGSKLLPLLLADAFGSSATTYDDLKAIVVDVLKAQWPQISDMLRAQGAPDLAFDLIVAGISERSGPDAYFLCNHDGHKSAQLKPWTVTELPALIVVPLDDEGQEKLDLICAGRGTDELDPAADGVRILEIQREMNLTSPIGGFAQLTSVAAGSISTRIICRWDGDQCPR
jgi:hypothetical protein